MHASGLALAAAACVWTASCAPGAGSGNVNDNAGGNVNRNVNDNTGAIEPGVEIDIPNEGQDHVEAGTQVQYETNPPASGPHWSSADPEAPVDPGLYLDPLEEEQWVHNLEHGYVVILYDCEGECDEAFLTDLGDLVEGATPSEAFGYAKIVVAPYDGLPFTLAAIAWDVQLHLEAYDADTLFTFFDKYQDQGPESAP